MVLSLFALYFNKPIATGSYIAFSIAFSIAYVVTTLDVTTTVEIEADWPPRRIALVEYS
jgi:hypothetical protein